MYAYGDCSPGFKSQHRWKFFSVFTKIFASFSATLTLDVGLFYLFAFPVPFVKPTHILLPLLAPLPLCCTKLTFGLSLTLFSLYLPGFVKTKH